MPTTDDLIDVITAAIKGQAERGPESSGADDGDQRLASHRVQNNTTTEWLVSSTRLSVRPNGRFAYSVGMASQGSKKSRVARPRKLKIVSSRVAFRGPVFSVVSDEVVEPGGIRARRDIIRHSGSVVVLAIDDSQKDPRVLLEWQYRYAAKDYLWELPAGRIDPGEDEVAAAKRELLEETGYSASSWQRALKFYASPGFLDETMAIYLARRLHKGKAQPEPDELIRLRLWPLSAALKMISRQQIRDGKTRLTRKMHTSTNHPVDACKLRAQTW